MKLKLFVVGIISLLLMGCDNARFKSPLQIQLNSYNNSALCYPLPKNITGFPYEVFSKQQHEALLNLFTDLALLKKSSVSFKDIDGSMSDGARYSLTTEGKSYYQGSKGAFCFASVVVDNISGTDDIEVTFLGSRVDTGKWVYYTYYFSDIPEWAKNEQLKQYYERIELDERLYDATSTYRDSSHSYSSGIDFDSRITLKE